MPSDKSATDQSASKQYPIRLKVGNAPLDDGSLKPSGNDGQEQQHQQQQQEQRHTSQLITLEPAQRSTLVPYIPHEGVKRTGPTANNLTQGVNTTVTDIDDDPITSLEKTIEAYKRTNKDREKDEGANKEA